MPLTDMKIRQTKATDKPVKITDGNGLYLEVRPNGSKLWRYRYEIGGHENTYAIGSYPDISLQEARKARDAARELVKQGQHPAHIRKMEVNQALQKNRNTFKDIAMEWYEKRKPNLSAKHSDRILRCLELNAMPQLGTMPVHLIKPIHVLEVLQVMEKRGVIRYALFLRQLLSQIFCYAIVTQRAEIDPAAPLKGAFHPAPIKHSTPMKKEDLADLKIRLERYGGNATTIIAMKMLMHTFVRTKELLDAPWNEFDFDKKLWAIPPERMKMRSTHIVPLSTQVLALLEQLKAITGDGIYLFPNVRTPNKTMSGYTINRALENMGYPRAKWTGHDFRATASTHLYEMGYRSEIVELQLAHKELNQVKAAYNHAQYIPERVKLMQDWSDWLDSIPPKLLEEDGSQSNEIVQLVE